MGHRGMDSNGSGYVHVTVSCERGSKLSGSIQYGTYLQWLPLLAPPEGLLILRDLRYFGISDCLILEDGTASLSRNVGTEMPLYAAQNRKITRISFASGRKPEI
jgi:hypothetical protein